MNVLARKTCKRCGVVLAGQQKKYCSRSCCNRDKNPAWLHTPELLAKSTTRLNRLSMNELTHPNWSGDNVGIGGIHKWVMKHLGRPQRCDKCGTTATRKYEWANRSRTYKRDLTDWIRLCVPCHRYADVHRLPL